jgi:hypothetical protein
MACCVYSDFFAMERRCIHFFLYWRSHAWRPVVLPDQRPSLPTASCQHSERTWIFTRPVAGLALRHDHRHADGTPDRVTMYGGMAQPGGTARSQAFLSDAYTARLVPGADTNLWTVTVSEDGAVLTYRLERHARPRAEFVMKRVPG